MIFCFLDDVSSVHSRSLIIRYERNKEIDRGCQALTFPVFTLQEEKEIKNEVTKESEGDAVMDSLFLTLFLPLHRF
jgi:hypothetical protein